MNLLANVNPEMEPKQFLELCIKVKKALLEIRLKNLEGAAAKEVLKRDVAPVLWKVNACPDFIEDRGHYFGTDLADADKNALIEYLKTL